MKENKKTEDLKNTSNGKPSFASGLSVNDPNIDEILAIPNEPIRFAGREIDRILIKAYELGVSDITIQTEQPIIYQLQGKIFKVSKHSIDVNEIKGFIEHVHDDSAISHLNGGKPLNKAHFIRDDFDTSKYYRYRINTTKQRDKGDSGYQITARVIPSNIPYLSDMSLPEDLEFNLLNFSKGIALITGATGSGKSTLLASIIAEFLRNDKYHKKIITAEEPIEFTYESIKSKHSFISQSEIPYDLPSFAVATANALRRAPNIILIGESRDAETIREATVASMTGHEVYTTVHSNGFMDTFRRMIDVFPEAEKPGAASALISNTKIVLSQRLVPSTDGRRVALREYVILNDDIREILLLGGPDKLTYTCKQVLDKFGYSFTQDAKKKFEEGRISEEEYRKVIMDKRMVDESEMENGLKENMEVEILKVIKTSINKLEEQSKINNMLLNKLFDLDDKINSIKHLHNTGINVGKNDEDVDLNF